MNYIHTIDSIVASFFLNIRTPSLTRVFEFITIFGSPLATTIITLVLAAIIYRKHRTYFIPLLTTTINAGLTIYITKILFHRQRPLDALVIEKSFSFPSGHALISIALYGLLTYIIHHAITARHPRKEHQLKITTIAVGSLLILLIGISRLYLGVHYFSDVLGGYLIGAIWLTAGVIMLRKTTNG